jgi:hypothetical protein
MSHDCSQNLLEDLGCCQPSLRCLGCCSLVPRRLAETLGVFAPAVMLDRRLHLLVHTFGMWASVIPILPLHLDFHEDAVDVLPVTPAVAPLANVPDPVLAARAPCLNCYSLSARAPCLNGRVERQNPIVLTVVQLLPTRLGVFLFAWLAQYASTQ